MLLPFLQHKELSKADLSTQPTYDLHCTLCWTMVESMLLNNPLSCTCSMCQMAQQRIWSPVRVRSIQLPTSPHFPFLHSKISPPPPRRVGWAGLGWADRKRMYLRLARRRHHHTPPAWRPYTLTASMHLLLCSIEVILVTVIILENQTLS